MVVSQSANQQLTRFVCSDLAERSRFFSRALGLHLLHSAMRFPHRDRVGDRQRSKSFPTRNNQTNARNLMPVIGASQHSTFPGSAEQQRTLVRDVALQSGGFWHRAQQLLPVACCCSLPLCLSKAKSDGSAGRVKAAGAGPGALACHTLSP